MSDRDKLRDLERQLGGLQRQRQLGELTEAFDSLSKDRLDSMKDMFVGMADMAKSGAASSLSGIVNQIVGNQPIFQILSNIVEMISLEVSKDTIESAKNLMVILSDPANRAALEGVASALAAPIELIGELAGALEDLKIAIPGTGEEITGLTGALRILALSLKPIPLQVMSINGAIDKWGEMAGIAEEQINALKVAITAIATAIGGPLALIPAIVDFFTPEPNEPPPGEEWEPEGIGQDPETPDPWDEYWEERWG